MNKTAIAFLSALLFLIGCSPKIIDATQGNETATEEITEDPYGGEEYVFTDSLDYSYTPKEYFYTDYVFKESIETVQFRVKGTSNDYPIIPLWSTETLELQFDELESEDRNYSYKVLHCNSNWEPTDVSPFEYIDGFTEGDMENYEYAHGTTQPYTTYWLTIPNAITRFTKSGNYILIIYEEGDDEDIVLTRRFMIYENQWGIESRFVRPSINRYQRGFQNLDFKVLLGDQFITNPMQEVKVTVLQNGRWDNAVQDIRPFFANNQFLRFRLRDQELFKAGKEFRYFDTRDLTIAGDRIEKVVQDDLGPLAYVEQDVVSAFEPYSFKRDLNGSFYIYKIHKIFESAVPDYVRVNFSLKTESPITNGNVYLFGKFTDWNIHKENQMSYNSKNGRYECRRLLKQGLYNYQYVIQADGAEKLDDSTLEGNYWQTENDYIVLVYYAPFNGRFDRLVAIKQINSGN